MLKNEIGKRIKEKIKLILKKDWKEKCKMSTPEWERKKNQVENNYDNLAKIN